MRVWCLKGAHIVFYVAHSSVKLLTENFAITLLNLVLALR